MTLRGKEVELESKSSYKSDIWPPAASKKMRWDIWKIFFQTIEAIFPHKGMFFTKVVKAKIGIYKKHKFLDPFFCEKHPIQKCQPLDHSALSTLVSNSLTPV